MLSGVQKAVAFICNCNNTVLVSQWYPTFYSKIFKLSFTVNSWISESMKGMRCMNNWKPWIIKDLLLCILQVTCNLTSYKLGLYKWVLFWKWVNNVCLLTIWTSHKSLNFPWSFHITVFKAPLSSVIQQVSTHCSSML